MTDCRCRTEITVLLGQPAADRGDAISRCGSALVELGAVEQRYVDAMHRREQLLSTYIGEEIAIPHGTEDARQYVTHTAMAVLQFPDGVDWDGHRVTLCVALAAHCDRHLRLLATLAMILADSANAARLRHADDVASVVSMLLGETNEITR